MSKLFTLRLFLCLASFLGADGQLSRADFPSFCGPDYSLMLARVQLGAVLRPKIKAALGDMNKTAAPQLKQTGPIASYYCSSNNCGPTGAYTTPSPVTTKKGPSANYSDQTTDNPNTIVGNIDSKQLKNATNSLKGYSYQRPSTDFTLSFTSSFGDNSSNSSIWTAAKTDMVKNTGRYVLTAPTVKFTSDLSLKPMPGLVSTGLANMLADSTQGLVEAIVFKDDNEDMPDLNAWDIIKGTVTGGVAFGFRMYTLVGEFRKATTAAVKGASLTNMVAAGLTLAAVPFNVLVQYEKAKQKELGIQIGDTLDNMAKMVDSVKKELNGNTDLAKKLTTDFEKAKQFMNERFGQLGKQVEQARKNMKTLGMQMDEGFNQSTAALVRLATNVDFFQANLNKNFDLAQDHINVTQSYIADLGKWTAGAFNYIGNLTSSTKDRLAELDNMTSTIKGNLITIATTQEEQKEQLTTGNTALNRILSKLNDVGQNLQSSARVIMDAQKLLKSLLSDIETNAETMKYSLAKISSGTYLIGLINNFYNDVVQRANYLQKQMDMLPRNKEDGSLVNNRGALAWAKSAVFGDNKGVSLDEVAYNLDTMVMGLNRGLRMRSVLEWWLDYTKILEDSGALTGTSARWYMEILADQLTSMQVNVYLMQVQALLLLDHQENHRNFDYLRMARSKCYEMEEMLWRQDPVIGAYLNGASSEIQTADSQVQTFRASDIARVVSLRLNGEILSESEPVALRGCRFCTGDNCGLVSDTVALSLQCHFRNFYDPNSPYETAPVKSTTYSGVLNSIMARSSSPSAPKTGVRYYYQPGIIRVANPDTMTLCGIQLMANTSKGDNILSLAVDICSKPSGDFIGQTWTRPGNVSEFWFTDIDGGWVDITSTGWLTGIGLNATTSEDNPDKRVLHLVAESKLL